MISSRNFPTMPDAFFCISVVIWVYVLFKRYSELQSTNNQAFLDAFQKLYLFMEPLSVDATQQASQVVCNLCSETERMAFIIGLHAGMQFAWEVTEPTEVKL